MNDSHVNEMQKTLRQEVAVSGMGMFTGEKSSIRICPSLPNSGVIFRRIDLPGFPEIPARLEFVRKSPRCTQLMRGDASVMMVEHLLSALYAYGIDNARIDVEGPEIPATDGSAQPFVALIEQAGVQIQREKRTYLAIKDPVFLSEGDIHLVALPYHEFRLSYTMHYPRSSFLKSQYYSFSLRPDKYREEIASCRTFSLYEEIIPFIEKGLIKGGGLNNALVIRGDQIVNPEGARFPDEMVRHKILDLIGDLSLVGAPILAHVIAICSGHASNVAFANIIQSRGK